MLILFRCLIQTVRDGVTDYVSFLKFVPQRHSNQSKSIAYRQGIASCLGRGHIKKATVSQPWLALLPPSPWQFIMTKFYFFLAPHIRLRVFVILNSPLLVIVLYFAAIFLLEPPFSAETKMLNSRSFEMYWNESGQLDSLNCWLEKEKMTSKRIRMNFRWKNSFEEINLKKSMKQKEELAMLQLLTKAQKICGTRHVQRLRVKTSFDSSLFVVNHVSLEWIF